MPKKHIVGLLLAGGAGRRLAKNKGWREIGGTPIAERALAALGAVADEVVVVGDCETPAGWTVRRVGDDRPGAGPLAAMLTGMDQAPADLYVVVAWDMPFVTAELLGRLIAECQGTEAVVPRVGERDQPLCAVYARACRAAIAEAVAQGVARAAGFFPKVQVKRLMEPELAAYGDPERLFLNVNTPDDLAVAERLAAGEELAGA